MLNNLVSEKIRRLEISGRIAIVNGHGGLPLVKINTPWSTAEIYLHGAHAVSYTHLTLPTNREV